MSSVPDGSTRLSSDRPLVSVVIPAYNAESTLERAVRSVQADAWQRTEILIVNDGSRDATLVEARRLSVAAPEQIRVLHQDNAGAGAARNRGMEAAAGEFIQFLDADDEIQNDKLAHSVAVFARCPDAVCVYSRGEELNHSAARVAFGAHVTNLRALADRNANAFTFALNTGLPLWRREFLLRHGLAWDPELPCWQEAEFHVRCLLAAGSAAGFVELDIPGLLFHRDASSAAGISSGYWSHRYLLGQREALDKIMQALASTGVLGDGMLRERRAFARRLLVRAVIGDQPGAYAILKSDLGRLHREPLRSVTSWMGFGFARGLYRIYRALKGTPIGVW